MLMRTGVFLPQRTDDLKPAAAAVVGQPMEFWLGWQIEEGPYAGEMTCIPQLAGPIPFGWCPESDVAWLEAEPCRP